MVGKQTIQKDGFFGKTTKAKRMAKHFVYVEGGTFTMGLVEDDVMHGLE